MPVKSRLHLYHFLYIVDGRVDMPQCLSCLFPIGGKGAAPQNRYLQRDVYKRQLEGPVVRVTCPYCGKEFTTEMDFKG